MGCDFSNCITDQDYLDAIEAFEDVKEAEAKAAASAPSAAERQAAALEAIASGATAENAAVVDALLGEDE